MAGRNLAELLRADATCKASLYSPLWSMAVKTCVMAEFGQTQTSALGSMLRAWLYVLLPSYFGLLAACTEPDS
jgi:hypothetical protein